MCALGRLAQQKASFNRVECTGINASSRLTDPEEGGSLGKRCSPHDHGLVLRGWRLRRLGPQQAWDAATKRK